MDSSGSESGDATIVYNVKHYGTFMSPYGCDADTYVDQVLWGWDAEKSAKDRSEPSGQRDDHEQIVPPALHEECDPPLDTPRLDPNASQCVVPIWTYDASEGVLPHSGIPGIPDPNPRLETPLPPRPPQLSSEFPLTTVSAFVTFRAPQAPPPARQVTLNIRPKSTLPVLSSITQPGVAGTPAFKFRNNCVVFCCEEVVDAGQAPVVDDVSSPYLATAREMASASTSDGNGNGEGPSQAAVAMHHGHGSNGGNVDAPRCLQETNQPKYLARVPTADQLRAASEHINMPETPLRPSDHGIESNVRDTARYAIPAETHGHLSNRDVSPATLPVADPADDAESSAMAAFSATSPSAPPASIMGAKEMAYCKLMFADGYYLITTTHVMLVRDLEYQDYHRKQLRQKKKRRKHEQQTRWSPHDHEHDPNQPTQGDYAANNEEELVGRPALPPTYSTYSGYSDLGGVVGIDGDNEGRRPRRRRQNRISSSNHSIAPQSLHLDSGEEMTDQPYTGTEYKDVANDQWVQLPIHTPDPQHIKTISKEHLLFRYNSDRRMWVADVVGNGAFIGGESYRRGDKDIPLSHDAEIFVSTVRMTFMLPLSQYDEEDGTVVQSVEDDYDAYQYDLTPEIVESYDRRSASDDGEEDEELAQTLFDSPEQKKSGSKRRAVPQDPTKSDKRKGLKDHKKKSAKTVPEASHSVAPPTEKEASSATAEIVKIKASSTSAEPQAAKAASAEHQLDPNSAYANVPVDQLPEKRKGPGRPPKNGLISKRDDAAVKRKIKEYQRDGIEPPPHNEILDIVRREQRQKDAAAKAQQRGEPAPEASSSGREASASRYPVPPGNQHSPNPVQPQTQVQGEGNPDGVVAQGPTSPRLRHRTARTPSPVPPRESLTEEQLKKPTTTYLYIIDDVLQEMGQGDLPAIYDKMMKRWPYFKYICKGNGWQSSVRHNLLGNDRFVESGKSGKGKYWVVNHDVPLDSKRKRTPPPRRPVPPMQLPNGGQHSNQQYGQQPYIGGYGQQPVNGQVPPMYAGPHVNGHLPPQHPTSLMHPYPSHPPANQPFHPPPQMAPPAPTNANQVGPNQALVTALVQLHASFLQSGDGPSNPAERAQIFTDTVALYEGVQAGTRTLEDGYDVNAEPYRSISASFRQHGTSTQTQQNPQSVTGPSGPDGASADASGTAVAGSSTESSAAHVPAQESKFNEEASSVAAMQTAGETVAPASSKPAPLQDTLSVPQSNGASTVQPLIMQPANAIQVSAHGPPTVTATPGQTRGGQQPNYYEAAAPEAPIPISTVDSSRTMPTPAPAVDAYQTPVDPGGEVVDRPDSAGKKRSADDEDQDTEAKRTKVSHGSNPGEEQQPE